jgi:DNA excision repair protein ERCC-2
MEIKASVREIAEMIYGSGDLISETYLLQRAEEGKLIHKEHQSLYKKDDQSEVYIDYQEEGTDYSLFISGRIDGVIKRNRKLYIEEIKSTTKDLEDIDENTVPAHLAQAKIYAYFYLRKYKKKKMNIRLTYIHVQTRNIKQIDLSYSELELASFFKETIKQYLHWLKLIETHEENRNKSILGLSFPFDDYREGQRELMKASYKTFIKNGIFYAIAPTGVGKTIATLFSSLKAINQNNQKIFYLTAKNLGKRIALKTMDLLLNKGLQAKAIEITAKDLICLQDVRDCDPEKCPYSKSYFSKIFAALQDLHQNEDLLSKEIIIDYAKKHQVCPFELSLDFSYYADVIICDYNYAFCPRTHLIRYFDEESKYRPFLLVDEAHNLVNRSKDMYSGRVSKISILSLRKILKENNLYFDKEFNLILKKFDEYQDTLKQQEYLVVPFDEELVGIVYILYLKIDERLNESKNIQSKTQIIKILLDLVRFYKVAEFYDSDYVFTLERKDGDIIASINCLDASKFLLKTIKEKTYGCLFFSATLYPINYYRKMLTESEGNFVQIDSPFEQEHLHLINVDNVSTRYRDRTNSIETIISTIKILANSKVGNYIVFFPSYIYLEMVKKEIEKQALDFELIIQKPDFTLQEREDVINLFHQNDITQVAFFVMGGMFSEGIDYLGDMLSGVIVVGVGLPMFGGYNNIVKEHFDEKTGQGFDFAYTYPGFAKVIQAVGRVIRTETDRGIAILIDDRFSNRKYQCLFPKEWSHLKRINDLLELSIDLNDFWSKEEIKK